MNLKLILVYALIHLAFNLWTEHSKMGRGLKHYLQNWRADGWFHGVLCSVSVFILFSCGIVGLALTLSAIGL